MMMITGGAGGSGHWIRTSYHASKPFGKEDSDVIDTGGIMLISSLLFARKLSQGIP